MNQTTLKRALLANALFSTVCGLGMIAMNSQVAALIGIGAPGVYLVIGAGLLLFAGFVFWTAMRNPINAFLAALISLADLLWVLGTAGVIVLAFGSLQTTGILALLAVAAVVLFFALRQLSGIEQMFAAPGKSQSSRLCVSVATQASADSMWQRIADLGGIGRYSPSLAKVILRNNADAAVNAVRQCTDRAGKTWAEHCTRLDADKRIANMTFLAAEAGFPYPFNTMTGGWAVVEQPSGSDIKIWFEVTPKHRLLHPFILAMMSKDLARSFADIVTRMVIDAQALPAPEKVTPSQHNVAYELASC